MAQLIYGGIVLFATLIGAIAGIGGGVIIKPLLDVVKIHSTTVINFYSSLAVLTMAVVSIIKQIQMKTKIDLKPILILSVGSILGGYCGDVLFQLALNKISIPVSMIQALFLAIVLVVILAYSINKDKVKTYHLKNSLAIILVGFCLGTSSVFLGIGGGPLNVAVFSFFFSYEMKQATVLSIVTIFFSQLTKLINVAITQSVQLTSYDLSFIPWIMIAAILGGYIGSIQNKKMETKTIMKIHNWTLFFLILLSMYNFFNGFMV